MPQVSPEPIRGWDRVALFLLPSALQSRGGWRLLKAITADWALVGLNWLVLGAILVPLHELFPDTPWFDYTPAPPWLMGMAILQAALITLIGHTEGLYRVSGEMPADLRALSKSVGFSTVVLCVAVGLEGSSWGRCLSSCAAGFLHMGTLWFWRESRRRSRHDVKELRNVIIVGSGGTGSRFATYLNKHGECGRTVCGVLDDEKPLGNGVVGRPTDLARLARTTFADEIILAAPRKREIAMRVLDEARQLRLDVEIVPDLLGCKPSRELEKIGELPLICLHAERLPKANLAWKRVLDVLGASLVLVVGLPIIVAIALLIKLDSPGPALYCAPRVGRKGRVFRCYKFRTMVANADELKQQLRQENQRAGPFFKIASDPRITRVGHRLRRYSLDEIPQLWNVIKGEMSLVGPRPHPLDDVSGYAIDHLARLDVTPGITGLWQVTARRDPSFERGMELDREYIRTWSLGMDLRILLRTIFTVAQGSGE